MNAFRLTAENEMGVIRMAECEYDDALWECKSTQRGMVISYSDDNACISLRVPLALVAAFAQEVAEQRAALKDSTGYTALVWGGPAA